MADNLIKHRFYFFTDRDNAFGSGDAADLPELMGCFQKIGGLSADTDEIELKTGCDANAKKYPGVKKYGSVNLTKPLTLDSKMLEWAFSIYQARTGSSAEDKRYGYILVMDKDGRVKLLYVLYEAWPSSNGIDDLDAQSVSDAWLENIELYIRKFERFVIDNGNGIAPVGDTLTIPSSALSPTPDNVRFPIPVGGSGGDFVFTASQFIS